jgi:hypothetical protein
MRSKVSADIVLRFPWTGASRQTAAHEQYRGSVRLRELRALRIHRRGVFASFGPSMVPKLQRKYRRASEEPCHCVVYVQSPSSRTTARPPRSS